MRRALAAEELTAWMRRRSAGATVEAAMSKKYVGVLARACSLGAQTFHNDVDLWGFETHQ